jgi:hypothetical protein
MLAVTTQAQIWTQTGNDIDGEADEDYSGASVSLSSDGTVVAIGAYGNDGNGLYAGHVRIYENQSGTWTQIGSDIDAEAAGDYSGCSVSLSSDGSVVAIGAYGNDGTGSYAGHVRIYENQSGTWTQIGSDIDGEAAGDNSGFSVSLSSDGSVVAIGAYRNDGNSYRTGHVRIYENLSGTWTQIGSDIDGEADEDYSGYSVSLSSNGSVVAIGAYGNDGNGTSAGHVRVYQLLNPPSITSQPPDQTNVCPNGNVSFTIAGDDIDTYQWQVDDGSGFDNITNGGVYAGAQTNTLSITGVALTMNNYQYRCIVSNTAGNTTSDAAVLTTDYNDPVITSTHNDQQIDANASCQASLPDYTGDVTATDNCDADLEVTQNPTAGTTISGTSNTVTLTVTDDAGNFAEVTFNVEVLDNTNPTITSTHIDQQVDANASCEASLPDYTSDVTATDNCDADLDVTQSPTAGTTISGTTNTVTLTVTDDAGNFAEVTFNVEVLDNTNPTISSTHNDQQVDADADCEASLPDYTGDVTATDNCDADLDVTQSPTAGTTILGTTNTVTLTVTDDAGNFAEVTFNVEVLDNTNPTITSTHTDQQIDADSNCEASLPDYAGDVTATDNCDATPDVTQSPTAGTTVSGTSNTVTLTVTDDAGNYAETSFNVDVIDNTNPTISCPETISIDLSEGETFYTVQGQEFDPTETNDNCGISSIENDFNNTETLAGEELPVGTTTVVWTLTDVAGNSEFCQFDVLVNEFVGISDLSEFGINIYPNPTSGLFVIAGEAKQSVKSVEVTDISGKTIKQISNPTKDNLEMDLSACPAGIYFLKITTNKGIFTEKIIKQ